MIALTATTWHGQAVTWTTDFGIVLIAAGMLMCIYRLLRGPHLVDRALSVDTLSVQLIGLVLLLSIRYRSVWFLDGVLVLSLLGFAGTVAMAQYIARPHMRKKSGGTDPAQVSSAPDV
jgi:multicomponent K+:H+ antiporter subunit F